MSFNRHRHRISGTVRLKLRSFEGWTKDLFGLFGFLGLSLLVSAIGGAITATSVGSWYQELVKPDFNPPNWVFTPVWLTLYVFMAVAAWRVWRGGRLPAKRQALWVYYIQLGLNLIWSFIFFGARRIDLALIEIVILLAAIAVNTALFWRIDRWAGAIFAPYVAWVAYATLLNASLWILNRA